MCMCNCTVLVSKSRTTSTASMSILNVFSEFFHWHILQKICDRVCDSIIYRPMQSFSVRAVCLFRFRTITNINVKIYPTRSCSNEVRLTSVSRHVRLDKWFYEALEWRSCVSKASSVRLQLTTLHWRRWPPALFICWLPTRRTSNMHRTTWLTDQYHER